MSRALDFFWDKWDERKTYSQFGEDAIILSHFYNKNWKSTSSFKDLPRGFYVDVGAHHPCIISNTWLFYKQGWSGIAIDPNPGYRELFSQYRPRDVFLEVACSSSEGIKNFYRSGSSPMNTLDPSVAERIGFSESMQVETLRLETILEQYLPAATEISFLNVDVEGHDIEVLSSNNWSKFRPEIVCVELHEDNIEKVIQSPVFGFMRDVSYKLTSWSRPSLIFQKV